MFGNDKSLRELNFNTTDGDSEAIIDGGTGNAVEIPQGASAGTIQGFTIRSNAFGIRLRGPATVTGNLFDETDESIGILVFDGTAASVVSGNDFTDTPSIENQWAIWIAASSPTVTDNDIANFFQGIVIQNSDPEVVPPVISNPVVSGNRITGMRGRGPGNPGVAITVNGGSQATLVGNSITSPGADDPAGVVTDSGSNVAMRRNRILGHSTGVTTLNSATLSLSSDLIAGGSDPRSRPSTGRPSRRARRT